ncbi:hypothetical protein BV898_06018 [Hypsibius exemplaris]|uniref:G-protein coupled receptors family 1 profile domain-containing protein n=1 Tax=Hypsibius exemplaris TaxID=2072580 RepID=A0A1W0WXS6_HYPEX|nr:hypothetical protein BV898_06018 [Hypsibius exemplaris]
MNNTSFINRTFSVENTRKDVQLFWWIFGVLATNTFGALANIILLIAMVIHRPLRQFQSRALIIHCILIDIYASIIQVPTATIPVYLTMAYPLAKDFCLYQGIFGYFTYAASMYSASVLALHRVVATIFPRHFNFLTTERATICLIVLPWFPIVIINIFPALKIGLVMRRNVYTAACSFARTGKSDVAINVYTTFAYYVPTVIMGVSYFIVLIKTWITYQEKKSSRALQRRLEISWMLFVSFIWHCCTIYPFIIVNAFFSKEFARSFTSQLFV